MDQNKNINLENPDWKEFLNSLELYLNNKNKETRYSEILENGLKVFYSIDGIISSHMFAFNHSDKDFEHKLSLPKDKSTLANECFEYLIESGKIGESLANNNIIEAKFSEKKSKDSAMVLIIPLISNSGTMGIVILLHQIKELGQLFIRLCSLHSSLFASNLQNYYNNRKLENSKIELEQKISLRTMQLAQSQRETNAIFDSVLTAILVIDEQSNSVIKVNPFAQDLIGTSEENIIYSKAEIYLACVGQTPIYNRVFESELINNEGVVIPILRNTSKLNLSNKSYIIENFVDITDRKKAEIALKESNNLLELKVQERTEELQLLVKKLKHEIAEREEAENEVRKMLENEKELGELRNRFVSMVSHEFRTPLTVIRTYSQMIEKFYNKLPFSETIDYLKRISYTVDNMTELIENVIFIGKSSSRKVSADFKLIDVKEICEMVSNELLLSQETERIININYIGDEFQKYSDKKLLRLIISNLLSNALKYSGNDTEIEFIIESNSENLQFKISDKGIGIPKNDLDKIYDVFHRANNVGSIQGTGIGMSVVLESLKKLDGRIEIQSTEGVGTDISVLIPALNTIGDE